jgi:methyl-accepting chemotaxis protein
MGRIGSFAVKHLSIAMRLGALSAVFVIGVFALSAAFLYLSNQMLNSQRQDELVSITDSAVSQIAAQHARAQAGDITMEQAQANAMQIIGDVRYRGIE